MELTMPANVSILKILLSVSEDLLAVFWFNYTQTIYYRKEDFSSNVFREKNKNYLVSPKGRIACDFGKWGSRNCVFVCIQNVLLWWKNVFEKRTKTIDNGEKFAKINIS